MERVKDLDLYLLLEVEPDADEKTLKTAYRKKALTCHPDKNPDNKEAIARFHQLSDAVEVLLDENTRRAYDNVLKARKAAELRSRQLDGKRRKLKEDLELREQEAKFQEVYDKKTTEEKLQREIDRLRKEGSRQLEEEQEYMRQQLLKEAVTKSCREEAAATAAVPARLKVKWNKTGSSCPYTRESLEKIFNKYGNVSGVVVNEKKGGSALVEFEEMASARMAANIETGFLECPLKVKPLFEDRLPPQGGTEAARNSSLQSKGENIIRETDFETLVMRRLRQEEERKRLIQKMMEEDDNS